VAQQRASDLAYHELRERIVDLRLPPGSMLNEHALAADLGLGRMPVREAIARLVTDRFIIVLPRRGTVVAPLGLEDVLDMFDAREAIECGVAHIVATRATAEDLATLRRLVDAADRARDGTDHAAYLSDDHEIHRFCVHMVRNTLLQDAADRLLLHNLRFWRTYWASRPAQHATMISHAGLLGALEEHDADRAEQAMREHLAASRRLLQASF
jgi:DNA-binding GntR family transcriptional regulator